MVYWSLIGSFIKRMKFPRKSALILSLLVFTSAPAKALPFKENPQSFTAYFNSLTWKDGLKRTFSNLSGCSAFFYPNTYSGDSSGYGCLSGYVSIDDPRGKIVCKLGDDSGTNVIKYRKFSNNPEPDHVFYVKDKYCRFK